MVSYDPNYIAKITLVDPPERVEDDHNGQQDLKLRITNDGGFYTPITSDGTQVGQVFQNFIINPDNSSDVIGYVKGNSYLFSPDNFTSNVLGLSLNEQLLAVGIRYFILEGVDNGGTLTLIDETVVHATGSLVKYIGGVVKEQIILTDPHTHYVTEVTISPPSENTSAATSSEGEDVEAGPSSFRFTSEDGFYQPMVIGNDNALLGAFEISYNLCERFRNSVYDTNTNVRIGTNQGFAFTFPTTYLPEWALPYIAIRHVSLEGGTLDILNEVVVGATGAFVKYVGWRFVETVISFNDPEFVADVKLVDPSTSGEAGTGGGEEGEGDIGTQVVPAPGPPIPEVDPSSDAAKHSCQLSALAFIIAIFLR